MKAAALTQEQLKSLLHYDPETGIFTWLERPAEFVAAGKYSISRTQVTMASRDAGKRAGTVDKKGYRRIVICGRSYAEHNLAWLYMTGEWPIATVDHRNLQKGENWWENLRPATDQENSRNKGLRKDSTTGLKGVKPHYDRFQARIQTSERRISLGLYDCPVAAHLAYVVAADIHHGQFARTS